jgi:peptide/nickel transport system permease protein
MFTYIIRRLLLIPLTLFVIVLVNFVIINLAPGDPTTMTEISQDGATRRQDQSLAFGSDDRYLQFREFYGLTLPILFNTWPWITPEYVKTTIARLISRKYNPQDPEKMAIKDYDQMRITFGDQARFVMPILLGIINDPHESVETRRTASRFFVRGGTRQAYLGSNLTEEQKLYNRKIGDENNLLTSLVILPDDKAKEVERKSQELTSWYNHNKAYYHFEPDSGEKIYDFFFETRFFRYISRVATLDFGTMRNDANKTVISEVTKRFKYSLTLSIIPMLITFVVCQIMGFTMALSQNRWPDLSLNVLCLALYAIPVFVVAPFLIEKVALNNYFPFSHIPIPISGFTSPDQIYDQKTSLGRFYDVVQHVLLPMVAVIYGTLAAESRLSRTAVLEVMKQDYVRTAKAKGVSPFTLWFKHIGRNASITIVTSIAGSLGIILAGSLIVETLFDINGFGKFFYDAIINRDFNVIMFSALAGSVLTLLGYLAADIAYTLLDPRLTLD